MEQDLLIDIIILIATAVFVVTVLKQIKLSPVLGYLIAGAVIGDNGFKIVTFDQTKLLGEIGVAFLLFAIGLDLSFERLKAIRKYVFELGSLQVFITGVIIAGAIVLINGNSAAAIIIGWGLALSSTAIVLQVIQDNKSQSTQVGRIALAILILQDLAVIPLLVITQFLSGDVGTNITIALGLAFLKAVVALLGIFIAGRLFLRPLFDLITTDGGGASELPIAVTILIVLFGAWGTQKLGLSLALGAFATGVLVAETEFRVQAEESIYPFKSLLLGLFFMTVGMNIDVKEVYSQISHIVTFSIALIVVKALIITALCILFGFNKAVAIHAGLLLSQGGEFAFILFKLAKEKSIIGTGTADILLLVVTCTMAITPILSSIGQKIAEKLESKPVKTPLQAIQRSTRDLGNHVVIAGFGKVGKMIARVLEVEGINYIAIDVNSELVKDEAVNGFPIFVGDISQTETLEAIGLNRASTLILGMSNEVTIKKSLRVISTNYQKLEIIVRLKNLKQAHEFYNSGASIIIPEEYETGLQLGGAVLKSVGVSENEINRIKAQFRAGNYVVAKNENEFIEPEDYD